MKPICSRCNERVALPSGLCRPCERVMSAFGYGIASGWGVEDPPEYKPAPVRLGFHGLCSRGLAHPSESQEFEDELRQWLEPKRGLSA